MQPDLIQPAAEAVRAGAAWAVILLGFAFAALTSLLASAGAKAAPLRRWRRLLHIVTVLAWTLTVSLAGLRWVGASTPLVAAVRTGLLLAIAWASLPILRDLFAGFAMAIEARVGIGDDVRIASKEGRIVALGLRSVVLLENDGTEVTLPNGTVASSELQRLNLAQRAAPCSFDLPLSTGADPREVAQQLERAAMLSPYAAPGRRAEAFLVADEHGAMAIRLRAFVFDRAYEARYRADILLRAPVASAR